LVKAAIFKHQCGIHLTDKTPAAAKTYAKSVGVWAKRDGAGVAYESSAGFTPPNGAGLERRRGMDRASPA
jgi:hypothetical protein